MPKANITHKAVGNDEAEWGNYDRLMKRWEGLSKSVAKQWAAEMREHPEFRKYIDNPTHKIVFINYEGFALFVKWKSRNRYLSKKETLAEMLENIKLEERVGI
ncbi:MAG TPA: excisionase [Enterococcus faecalis]|nr:excisionase [Enterococcus faecalis]